MDEPRFTLELDVKPDAVDEFLKVMADVVDLSRREAGVLQYDLLRDRKSPHQFNLVQRYASIEALQAHMAAPHSQMALKSLATLLTKPFVQKDYGLVE